jgi:hypothetical protein
MRTYMEPLPDVAVRVSSLGLAMPAALTPQLLDLSDPMRLLDTLPNLDRCAALP